MNDFFYLLILATADPSISVTVPAVCRGRRVFQTHDRHRFPLTADSNVIRLCRPPWPTCRSLLVIDETTHIG